MPAFRKKPVVIMAVQWTGDFAVIRAFIGPDNSAIAINGEELTINTLEGAMTASLKDWIIRGVKGELYPCKPDIFDATYEPA